MPGSDSQQELDELIPEAVRVMVAATEKHTLVLHEQNIFLEKIASDTEKTAKYINGKADGKQSLIDDIAGLVVNERNTISGVIDAKLKLFYYKVGVLLAGVLIPTISVIAWVFKH